MSISLKTCLMNLQSDITDDDNNLIKINTCSKEGVIYCKQEKFNKEICEFIKNRIRTKQILTDPKFNWQILNAMNIIYIDIDYYTTVKDNDENTKYCISLSTKAINIVHSSLNKEEVYYLTFIPETFKNHKLGAHVFMIYYENINHEMRERLCSDFEKDDELKDKVDTAPIKSLQVLFPFATKLKGRLYKYIENNSTFKKDINFYAIGINKFDNTSHMNDEANYICEPITAELALGEDDPLFKSIMESCDKLDDKIQSAYKNELWIHEYGKIVSMIIEFLISLKYLDNSHEYWKILANNDRRLREVMRPVMKIIYCFAFIELKGKEIRIEELSALIAKIFQPMIAKTVKEGEDTKRATIASIIKHAKDWASKYGIYGYLCPTTINYSRNGGLKNRPIQKYLNDYYHATGKQKSGFFDSDLKINIDGSNETNYDDEDDVDIKDVDIKDVDNKDINNKDEKKKEDQDTITLGELRLKCKHALSEYIHKAIIGFIKFIQIIMDGMTYEIKPFDDDLKNLHTRIIQTWCNMFLIFELIKTSNIKLSIQNIITSFVKDFVWIDEIKRNRIIAYVYNIKQTTNLANYPYNQWIRDNDTIELNTWMLSIYNNYIEPLLLYGNKDNISNILNLLIEHSDIEFKLKKKIEPLEDCSKEINVIFKNSIRLLSEKKSSNNTPIKLDPVKCPYFPMRNGLLKWIPDDNNEYKGNYIFSTENHDVFMSKCTNTYYNKNYDYNCSEYKRMLECIDQIYPVKEEKDYNLSLFASTLYGIGLKDQFHIMFGTGGDGKTTIINAVNCMLGSMETNGVVIEEDGRKVSLKTNGGLAGVMKSDALLSNRVKSVHDEGGKTELVDVRICSVQEPELTNDNIVVLNVAMVKELLSGSSIQVRGIFKESEQKLPNALICMQTNIKPIINDSTKGLERRISVYEHRSKFVTGKDDNYSNMEYHYRADAVLAENIIHNPKYWEALFQILLPYAVNNLRNGYIPISNIPKPNIVKEAINDMLTNNVDALTFWLSTELEPDNESGIIHFVRLCELIIDYNANTVTGSKILTGRTRHQQLKEIEKSVENKFSNHIFRLQEKYYIFKNSIRKIQYPNNCHPLDDIEAMKSLKLFKEKYLKPTCETSISANRKIAENDDVFIIGYKMSRNL